MAINRVRSDQQGQRNNPVRRRAAAVAGGLLGLLTAALVAVPPAGAATYPVTNLNDAGAGSLRAAIASANGSAGADTITFAGGLNGTIALTTGALEISEGVTITGPGSGTVEIDAGGASRHFDIHTDQPGAASVTIAGLTLTGGTAPADPAPVTPGDLLDGGSVVASSAVPASLTLDDVVLDGNTGGDGGAVQVRGVALTLTGSTLTDNTAQFGGGAVRTFNSDVQVIDTTMTGNSAALAGGALRVSGGHLTVQGSAVQNNDAGSAGGIRAAAEAAVTIEDSTISGNTATGAGVTGNGGGVVLDDLTAGSSTITDSLVSGNSAAANGGGADIGSGSVALVNVTVVGNTAGNSGGGIRFNGGTTTMTGATVAGNGAVHGGGILSTGPGATVRNSILAGNTATEPAERDLTVNALPADGPVKLDYVLVETAPIAGASSTLTAGSTILGQDPLLDPLADNGGPTQTRRPAANSPVIDKGKSFGSLTDQRGRERPVDLAAVPNRAGGDGADLGAVERSSGADVQAIANTVPPSIPTAAYNTVPLTVTVGTWAPAGVTFGYQWFAGAAPIAGAVTHTYTPTLADAGKTLTVEVTASRPNWTSATATSNATGPVAAVLGPVQHSTLPTVGGTARVGSVLTATSTGTWTPAGATTTRQWLRNGVAVAGATGPTYLLGIADLGKRISLRVHATLANYAPDSADSAQTAVVGKGLLTTSGTPRITGVLKVGRRLTAVPPGARPAASVRYQWLRNGKAIGAATHAAYALRQADQGKRISVRVTLSRPGYADKALVIKRAGTIRKR